MHPIDHARSSARAFGGQPEGHLRFHAFLDQSKAVAATVQHRVFLHSTDVGLALARLAFGEKVDVGNGLRIPTETMLLRHLSEDLERPATLDDWLRHIDPADIEPDRYDHDIPEHLLDFRYEPLAAAAQAWGGTAEDYQPVLDILTTGRRYSDSVLADLPMLGSMGPFIAEQCLGVVLNLSDTRSVPVRLIAERFITGQRGWIEPASRLVEAIPIEEWMTGPTRNNLNSPTEKGQQ
jgi:hypothetical protein